MARRYRIKRRKKSYYVVRDKYGRFKNWVSIGRSIRQDMRKRAKRKVKKGYGYLGDIK